MRIAPAMKVFLYVLTVADGDQALVEPVWEDRYQLKPKRAVAWLSRHGFLHTDNKAGLTAYRLTEKGQALLADIADDLWVHEYYLPGVIDFTTTKPHWWQAQPHGYALLHGLLNKALHATTDGDTAQLLIRYRLRLESDTQHEQAAIRTLMALIYADLDVTGVEADFCYTKCWAKVTAYELQCLGGLLSALNWTLSDFEMAFAAWLQQQPHRARFFTNFEVMTIVMYEVGGDQQALTALYREAARRFRQHAALVVPQEEHSAFV